MTLRRGFLLALALAACGSDPAPGQTPQTPAATVRFVLPGAGSSLPPPLDVPFPTDLYRSDPDGTVADTLEDWSRAGIGAGDETFQAGYATLDGFGRTTGAIFLIDGDDLDPASLPVDGAASLTPGSSVALVDVDPRASAPGARIPCVAGYLPRFHTLVVQPEGVVLEPAHRYAVVVTTAVRTVRARPLGAAPGFVALRDAPPGARTTPAATLYGTALDRCGIDRRTIAALTVFTTQSTHRQLRAARDALVAGRHGPVPQLSMDPAVARPYGTARFGASAHPGWTATLDAWLGTPPRDAMGRDLPGQRHGSEAETLGIAHDAIAAVLTGTFVSPEFRRPFLGTPQRTDGSIAVDPAGVPVPHDANKRIPVTLVLPRGAAPAAGWPVVIFGHGLGGQRKDLFSVANELARAGIATAGIDTAMFGQRLPGREADTLSLYPGTYRGPDGLPDMPSSDQTVFFGNLLNILALRDNIRQTALDYCQLRRLLTNPALDLSAAADAYGGAAPRLDGAHVGYVGNSLGGIIGTLFAAIEPEANPFVLNVPGAGVVAALAADSPSISGTLGLAGTALYRYPVAVPFTRFHPLVTLIQGILDGGDPAAYARDATGPAQGPGHDLWLVEVPDDEVVPNRSTELLARAMNLPQVAFAPRAVPGLATVMAPVRGNVSGRTQALVLQSPATHGANLDGRYGTRRFEPPFPREGGGTRFVRLEREVRVRQSVVPFQRAIARFLRSAWENAAVIDVTGMEPLLDYDDDGWTDEEERARNTNPFDPESRPPGPAPHARAVGF